MNVGNLAYSAALDLLKTSGRPVKLTFRELEKGAEDGPRQEMVQLRRKGNGKTQFLTRNMLSTAYRRKRDDIALRRHPWSSDSQSLNRALTLKEAKNMWQSFDSNQTGALSSWPNAQSQSTSQRFHDLLMRR